jgi:CheY-like chemotaxis protein
MNNRIVLIVEDDPNDEHLTLRAIKESKVLCSVSVVHNANQALNFLRCENEYAGRTHRIPNVIFVDNTLPGHGGSELVTEIRKIPELQLVPVVILSGSSDPKVVDRCHRAGANSFLEKPLELHDYVLQVGRAATYWLDVNRLPPSISRNVSVI